MRRRNPRPGRILDCSGAAAAVHRGLVADQHASRLARRDRLGWLYARRHPSGQPDRSPARPATLSRLERPERAVLLRHGAVRQPAPGARIPRFGRHRHGRHVYARTAGAHAWRRRGNPRPHRGLVHQLLHHRRVAVVPVRPRRNAAGLAQRFCYRRHPRRRRRLDCLGGVAARGFRTRGRAPAAARLSPGACEPGCPRPDRSATPRPSGAASDCGSGLSSSSPSVPAIRPPIQRKPGSFWWSER